MLDQHLRFEIDARVQPEIFVAGPGIAIAAAVGTAAIGIDAVAKRNVGAVVLETIDCESSGRYSVATPAIGDVVVGRIELLEIVFAMNPLEAIGRAQRRAPAFDRTIQIGAWFRFTLHGVSPNRPVVYDERSNLI